MTMGGVEASLPSMGSDIRNGSLAEFKRRAEVALPHRVTRVLLFGSRARGNSEPDSDWDVAVFVAGTPTPADRRALADAAYDLLVESGVFVQPVVLPFARFEEDTLLLRRIRNEGIPV